MIRIFDTDEVYLISDKTKVNTKRLEELISELKGYVQNISNYYRGDDANEIILKYNDIINSLELVKMNFYNCEKFLSIISGKYADSFDRAKSKMDMFAMETVPETVNLENNGLAFNNGGDIASELIVSDTIVSNM